MKTTVSKLATASGTTLLSTSQSWAQAQGGADMYAYGPHMMWGGGWYGMVLGPLFFVLVLLAPADASTEDELPVNREGNSARGGNSAASGR